MKRIILLIIILVLSFGICLKKAKASSQQKIRSTIVIDAGHGGLDGGAEYANVKEKDINLSIAKKLGILLDERDFLVIYTREGDYDLAKNAKMRQRTDIQNRVKLINESKAELYISLHLNSYSNPLYRGAQVFYTKTNSNSELLAYLVQNTLEKVLKNTRRKIKEANNLYLIKNTKKCGVLLEAGFLTNPEERKLLETDAYQEKIALAVYLAIIEFFTFS